MQEDNVVETLKDSSLNLVDGAVDFIPNLLVAILLVVLGVIIAKYVSRWLGGLVDYLENNKTVRSTAQGLGVKDLDIDGIVSMFVRWTILIIFFSAAVDVLGLSVLTNTFDSLVDFVPNILSAVVIAGLSFIAGNVLEDIVNQTTQKAGVKAHKFLAKATKVAVLVFGLPLAAAQLGLDLTILTNNITVVVAGVMLALGLAFGLGGQEVARKMLNDLYNNSKK